MWIIAAAVGYFLSAIASIIDKFFLTNLVLDPLLYTFYVGALSGLVVWLIPFGFYFPGLYIIALAFLSGLIFLLFLYLFFTALKEGEASRIIPFIGAFVPIISIFGGLFILGEKIDHKDFIAFLFLIAGGVIIAYQNPDYYHQNTYKIHRVILISLLASLFLSFSLILTKAVFLQTSFINGFIWARLGSFLGAVIILLYPKIYQSLRINHNFLFIFTRKSALILLNKGIGALGFFVINYSIALGPVSKVNALKGLEYLFVWIIALLVSIFQPGNIYESHAFKDIIPKLIGILSISFGLFLIAI